MTAIRHEAADTEARKTSRARGLLARLDARLLAPGSAHRLACVRTALAIALAVRIGIGAWTDLAGRPDAVFAPVLIVSWLPGVPPAGVLVAVQLVGVVAALLAATGTGPRATFAIAWMALLFLGALHGSAGKIMHNEVLLLLACAPVLLAASSARIGDRRTSIAYGWIPRASLAVVGSVYFLAGLQKLIHSGPIWFLGDNMSWVLYQGADAGALPAAARWIAGAPILPNLFALGAIGLELLAPVILYVRRTRPLYVLAALGMHGSITILLGLDYTAWVLAVAAVALPWDRVPRRSGARIGSMEPAAPQP
ncbi:MAG: hypothetical protein WKH47_10600 [Actinomycetes bacterium]